jgi:hypothetical protein
MDLAAVKVSVPLLAGKLKARFIRAADMGEQNARSATTCVDFMFAGMTVEDLSKSKKWLERTELND